MNNLMFDQKSLSEKIERLLLSVQIERSTDLQVAKMVVEECKELARSLKGCELLPRSVLYELRATIKILRVEIPYLKSGMDSAIEVADEIEMIFDLILRGECHENRVSGVPRIV